MGLQAGDGLRAINGVALDPCAGATNHGTLPCYAGVLSWMAVLIVLGARDGDTGVPQPAPSAVGVGIGVTLLPPTSVYWLGDTTPIPSQYTPIQHLYPEAIPLPLMSTQMFDWSVEASPLPLPTTKGTIPSLENSLDDEVTSLYLFLGW